MRSFMSRAAAPMLLAAALMLPAVSHAQEVLAQGAFHGASGHKTWGDVVVLKSTGGAQVVLQSNFNFDGAPDPKVGFGKGGMYDINSQLAPLKSRKGEQSYQVPASLDLSAYDGATAISPRTAGLGITTPAANTARPRGALLQKETIAPSSSWRPGRWRAA